MHKFVALFCIFSLQYTHGVDCNRVAEHYNVSYNQVYGWYRKYTGSGNNPESLRDRKGQTGIRIH